MQSKINCKKHFQRNFEKLNIGVILRGVERIFLLGFMAHLAIFDFLEQFSGEFLLRHE